ncbi:MAG: hypothetical protein ABI399_07930 [Bauldia sp.]
MSDIRLTFRSEDFPSVSQMLVELGVGFRVEPNVEGVAEVARPKPVVPPAPARKAVQKRKPVAQPRSPARADQLTAADRLREAIIRNQGAGGPGTAQSDEKPDA